MKELKASDLRIGNWVYDDEGIPCKINGMAPFDHSSRCDETEGCNILIDVYRPNGVVSTGFEIDINECSPIPLTEEWLLRAGFEKEDLTDFVIALGYEKTELAVCIHTEPSDSYCAIGANTEWGYVRAIQYVHQIQNLYHALTGAELEMKLKTD